MSQCLKKARQQNIQFDSSLFSTEHDFFKPQPIRGAAAYLLKSIIHDWSDPYASQILKRLREAAEPHTKLLIIDRILPYACRVPEDADMAKVPGYKLEEVPEPLPPNLGAGSSTAYTLDLNVRFHFSSFERRFYQT